MCLIGVEDCTCFPCTITRLLHQISKRDYGVILCYSVLLCADSCSFPSCILNFYNCSVTLIYSSAKWLIAYCLTHNDEYWFLYNVLWTGIVTLQESWYKLKVAGEPFVIMNFLWFNVRLTIFCLSFGITFTAFHTVLSHPPTCQLSLPPTRPLVHYIPSSPPLTAPFISSHSLLCAFSPVASYVWNSCSSASWIQNAFLDSFKALFKTSCMNLLNLNFLTDATNTILPYLNCFVFCWCKVFRAGPGSTCFISVMYANGTKQIILWQMSLVLLLHIVFFACEQMFSPGKTCCVTVSFLLCKILYRSSGNFGKEALQAAGV